MSYVPHWHLSSPWICCPKETPRKKENQFFVFLPDNVPAHRSVLVKEFILAKKDMTTLCHPPYSPHVDPVDFYLFPRQKSALKGRHFCDATEIFKNSTKELKRLSQNGFQECFHHPYSRWQKCKVAQWEYFEGNTVYIIVLLLYFRSKVIPGIFWRYHVFYLI
jgi:hypothetical protein